MIVGISRHVMEFSKRICGYVRMEWYAFPLGRVQWMGDEAIFLVEDLYIPRQIASRMHVEIPADVNVQIIGELDRLRSVDRNILLLGMWHSHGDLGVFHSGEDMSNISKIFQGFLKYLPSRYHREELIGMFKGNIYSVEPIIVDNMFRGIKFSFGVASIQIDFDKPIENIDFFVRWYKHFYDIKCFFEVLREYYKVEPIVKNLSKRKAYYLLSVVVNNRGDMLAEIFIRECRDSEISIESTKAKIRVVDMKKKPYFLTRASFDDIIRRIGGVMRTGELPSI